MCQHQERLMTFSLWHYSVACHYVYFFFFLSKVSFITITKLEALGGTFFLPLSRGKKSKRNHRLQKHVRFSRATISSITRLFTEYIIQNIFQKNSVLLHASRSSICGLSASVLTGYTKTYFLG